MSYQQQFYTQLRQVVAPAGKNFLMLQLAMNWDWQPLASGYVNPTEHQLVGTMPAYVGENDVPFYMSSATDTYDAYTTAFDSVEVDEAERQKQLNDINAQISALLDQQGRVYKQYNDEWKAANLPESEKKVWKKMTGWDLRLNLYADQLALLQTQKDAIINDEHSQALAAITEKRGFISMLHGNKTVDVPNFIVPTNGIEWRNKQAIFRKGGAIRNISLSYQPTSETIKWSRFFTYSWSHLTPSKGNDPSSTHPLVSIVPSGPVTTPADKSLDIEDDKHTNMLISFEGSTIVNVEPDPEWCFSAYLNKVAQLGSWRDGQTTAQVFGPNGYHSVITGFVAVYRPSFTICTSNVLYNTIRSIVTTGNQFSLGPFSFGTLVDNPSKKDYTFESSDPDKTIIVKSEATYAQIIGIIVQNPSGQFSVSY